MLFNQYPPTKIPTCVVISTYVIDIDLDLDNTKGELQLPLVDRRHQISILQLEAGDP